ncbi:MAG: YhcH/YjgK/YiaL family protein [Lentisphaeria bacterium]|nr:YhcH/YjgK/YiaL family protein [Lentisphaeria bacterium]
MIFDDVKNLQNYVSLAPEAVKLLIPVLAELSADTPNGKTILIEDKLFILISRYDTNATAEGKFEIHRNFADLQMLLDGSEDICYTGDETLECVSAYDEKNDYALYARNGASTHLALKPGNFAIFLPEEKHLPGRGDGTPVVKAVIKIHKSLLN